MKSLQQWFDEYAESHQNSSNQVIHFVCVPVIFFSIIGMLMSINSDVIANILKLKSPILENWAAFVVFFLMFYYIILSFSTFIKMFLFSVTCLIGNYYLSLILSLFYFSLGIFVVAWIGQFYGHKLEGKKPSFFKDLQFLLIGPAWVFEKFTKK
jgi:uncharacterized membrane protein YGL010W